MSVRPSTKLNAYLDRLVAERPCHCATIREMPVTFGLRQGEDPKSKCPYHREIVDTFAAAIGASDGESTTTHQGEKE